MNIIEYVNSLVLGIIEGSTEWLPISSTGHLILFNEFINNEGSFLESQLYLYVIQLGAIMAVVTLFFHKLNPFSPKKSAKEKTDTWQMWFKVVVASGFCHAYNIRCCVYNSRKIAEKDYYRHDESNVL